MSPSAIFRFRGVLMAPFGILLLVFGKPSPLSFWIGLSVALFGEALRLWGVGIAGQTTRKSTLEAPQLVTGGPFAYVRHPLYVGNTLMGLGGTIMAIGHWGLPAASLFFLAFLLFYGMVYGVLIPLEEDFLEKQFGEDYVRYKQETRRMIPRLTPVTRVSGTFSWSVACKSEIHTLIPLMILFGIMAWKMR